MNDDHCAPIQALLAGLTGQPTPRPQTCGGAIIPVTKDTHGGMARRFNVDLRLPNDPPAEGMFDARVACDRDVLSKMGVGGVFQIATCARCGSIEAELRKIAAEAAAKTGGT